MKIRIATTENRERYHHYANIVENEAYDWRGTIAPPFTDDKFAGIDAFICSCEWHLPTRLAIAACKRLRIPTFHVIDGIVEWRNLFENPRSSELENGAPLFRPLISDCTFAMGELQRASLRWLGNPHVFATGLPRLDTINPVPCRSGPTEGPPRLLVATANTAWFTADQKVVFEREFGSLVEGLASSGSASVPGLSCRWRVAGPVAAHFDLTNDPAGTAVEALSACDALVTTPSSLAVEAMLLGVPTLIFDPYACPVMTPSAWAATSAVSVLQLLPCLVAPDPRRAGLQDALRERIAPSDGDVTARIHSFIESVVQEGCVRVDANSSAPEVKASRDGPGVAVADSWLEHLSLNELQGLAATLPELERKLGEKQSALSDLYHEREHPTLRHALGCLYRFAGRLWR